MTVQAESLCWDCKRTALECEYIRTLIPYKGAEYETKHIFSPSAENQRVKVYIIKKCPFYKADELNTIRGRIEEREKSSLRARRIALRLTQKELGEKIGYTGTTIGAWEIGTRVPKQEQLEALSKVFGCNIEDIK